MKDYLWQRLANPVECSRVRTGVMHVLRGLLEPRHGASADGTPPQADGALAQALAYAERFGLVMAQAPLVLRAGDGADRLGACELAQVFVDPSFGALALRYAQWHRSSAPPLLDPLRRSDAERGEQGLRTEPAH